MLFLWFWLVLFFQPRLLVEEIGCKIDYKSEILPFPFLRHFVSWFSSFSLFLVIMVSFVVYFLTLCDLSAFSLCRL